jgi:hypothetical protein
MNHKLEMFCKSFHSVGVSIPFAFVHLFHFLHFYLNEPPLHMKLTVFVIFCTIHTILVALTLSSHPPALLALSLPPSSLLHSLAIYSALPPLLPSLRSSFFPLFLIYPLISFLLFIRTGTPAA